MKPNALLLAFLLVGAATALAPPAAATTACTPSAAGASACATHDPYQGSLYCETAWSSGGGSDQLSVKLPGGVSQWVHVGYWCFNYSNYGENPYQSSSIVLGTTVGGQNVWFIFDSYYETYYTSSGGPYYREGCRVYVSAWGPATASRTVACPWAPAPWGTLLTPLFQSYVSVNADCQSSMAPTVQVCWRGNPSSPVVGASTCTTSGTTRARVLGTTVDSPLAGIVGCLLFKGVLGP